MIAAALSIQDPRERPADKREEADQLRTRASPTSAPTSSRYVNLWRYLREQQLALSGNQFRKRCHAEFLHHLRVREWQDLVGAAAPGGQGRRRHASTRRPPSPTTIHVALLAGLLSHLGHARPRAARVPRRARRALRDLPRLGARAQAADLGDGRRARRDVAAVGADRRADRPALGRAARRAPDQAQLRRAALGAQARLGRRHRARDALRAADRRRAARSRTAGSTRSCRARCSSAARSSRATGTRGTRSSRANRALLEEVEELEHRARRRDIVVDDQALYDFYDARDPADVVSGAHFDRWWKHERRRAPSCSSSRARTSSATPATRSTGARCPRRGARAS